MAEHKFKTYFQTFTTDGLGQIFLTGILNVAEFRKVNVDIIQFPLVPVNMTVTCYMGKISGSTVAQTVGQFPLDNSGQISYV